MLGLEVLAELDVAQVAVVGQSRVGGVGDLDAEVSSTPVVHGMRHRHHLADHDDGRRPHLVRRELVGQRAEGGEHRALLGMVPSTTTATGVAAGRPPSTSASAMCGAFSTAIISTTVPRSWASAAQTTSDSGCPGARWPETTVNSWVMPRWVTGMPADAGTATEEERPGTTVTGTPAAAQARTSS